MKIEGIVLICFIILGAVQDLRCESITILSDQIFECSSDAKTSYGCSFTFSFSVSEDGEYLLSIFLRAEAAKKYSLLLSIEQGTPDLWQTTTFDFEGRGCG
jgi:hypothetical protein